MSVYRGFGSRESINLNLNAAVIAKPFTRDVLLQKLSEATDLEQRPVQ